MKNYRVLSLALALVMLVAVVFPTGVFADDLLEDEAFVEETAVENQIEDEYLDEPEDSNEPTPAENGNEELIDEDSANDENEALPEESNANNENEAEADDDANLDSSETDEFLAGKPVVTPPEDVEAAEGATVTFKVAATGTAPLTYKWQTKLVGKTTWQDTKLGGYNTATLSFPMVASYDGRQYRCVVTDKNGNKTASAAATLTLAAALTVTDPEDVEAAVDATVTFKVTATGAAPLTYKWQTKLAGKTTWQDTKLGGYNTATLSFPMVASYDGRQYRCVVTDANGNKVASGAAKLTLAAGTTVTNPEDVEAAEGETVTFEVTATGAAPFTYKWQTKLVGKTTWQDTKLGGYNTAKLSFPMVASYDGRQYRCVVTDANGNKVASGAATLTLAAAAPTVTDPEDVEAAEGETVTFEVTATGAAPFTYKWQTKLVGKTTWQDTKLGGYNTAKLSFPMVASYDGRQYRCVVTDANGNKVASGAATLTLAAAAPTVTDPEDVEAAEGETVTFEVTATGAAPFTYKWQTKLVGKTTWQDTKLGGYNTAKLSFPMVASYDGRQYRCIVTDANGKSTTSKAATLRLAKEIVVDDVVYEKLTDTTCSVKSYKGNASSLKIPKTVSGMTVTEIGQEAFMNNTKLTSIELPETITIIRARAFKDCTNLKEMK